MHQGWRLAIAVLLVVSVAGCGGTQRAPVSGATTPVQIANGPTPSNSTAIGPTGLARVHPTKPGPVPMLMYHVIGHRPASAPYPDLWVSPQRFAQQMHALRGAGYHAVTLDAVLANWRTGAPLPSHPIVLTFDDGYAGQSRYAAPVLRKLGWPAVLNLTVNHIGRDGISAARVRGLIADGWEIDSHTLTHPDLTRLGPDELRREVAGSRAVIRRRFGVPANAFCYPAGRYDPAVVQAVRAAGYRAATTVDPGYAVPGRDQRFVLARIRVNGDETAAALLESIAAARR